MEFGFAEEFERQERRAKFRSISSKIIKWVIVLAIVITAAYFITAYCVEKTNMTGDSMNPTLEDNDIILINSLAYWKSTPDRFDVIVFEKDGKEHSYSSLKRVIGLPGETVQIIDGEVYINGELLEEQNNVEPMKNAGMAAEPITLDEDEYFVLGDNRNASEDSRFNSFGNVTINEIKGKAVFRLNGFSIISQSNLKKNTEK